MGKQGKQGLGTTEGCLGNKVKAPGYMETCAQHTVGAQ